MLQKIQICGLVIILTFALSGIRRCLAVGCDVAGPVIEQLRPVNMWRLEVQWSDGCIQEDVDATYEIQVGRTETFDNILQTNISIKSDKKASIPYSWIWTSQLPLQCADHSVRLRRIINASFSSEWTPWKTNFGDQNQDGKNTKMFPKDQILREGASVLFCCVPRRGTEITKITFNNSLYPVISVGEHVRAINVTNLNASRALGVNFGCRDSKGYERVALNYVTFPPQKLQNVSCETVDMRTVTCSWRPGRPPNLSGSNKRNYALHVENMGTVECKETLCSFPVVLNRTEYVVRVTERNSLGQESVTLTFDIADTVFPEAQHVSVSPAATQATVSWMLDGSFSGLQLVCQIQTDPGRKVVELKVEGAVREHSVTVLELLPSFSFSTRVRCAVQGKDWGKWSDDVHFCTYPPVTLAVWRTIQVDALGRDVTVLWSTASCDSHSHIKLYEVCLERSGTTVCRNVTKTREDFRVGSEPCRVVVRAVLGTGQSVSSYISIPPVHSDGVVLKKRIVGSAIEGFLLSWKEDGSALCGYTVEWCMMGSAVPCSLQWRTVPTGHNSIALKAEEFEKGRRYSFNIFSCRKEGHTLTETHTGYTQELKPTLIPQISPSLSVTMSSVTLEWSYDEDDPRHPGFISGYQITVHNQDPWSTSHYSRNVSVNDPRVKQVTVSDLQPQTLYTFSLAAQTSAGSGPETRRQITTLPNYYSLTATALIPLLMLIGCCFLLWPHRKRLTEVAVEVFSSRSAVRIKAFDLDNGLFEASAKIQAVRVEECPYCDVEVVNATLVLEKMSLMHQTEPGLQVISSHPGYCPQTPSAMLDEPTNLDVMSITNRSYVPMGVYSSAQEEALNRENTAQEEAQSEENLPLHPSDYVTTVAILKL